MQHEQAQAIQGEGAAGAEEARGAMVQRHTGGDGVNGSFGSSTASVLIPSDGRKNPMRPEDHAHVERVITDHASLTREKYSNGREEHGGDCWTKPGMLAHALDEASDLSVYLWTLREQLLRIASECDRQGEHVTAARIRFVINK
jgi:hypothetical protein